MTNQSFQQQVDELKQQWATDPRWSGVQRDYTAEDVVRLQMLRQDGVFDRAEEGGMHAHCQQRRQHQQRCTQACLPASGSQQRPLHSPWRAHCASYMQCVS